MANFEAFLWNISSSINLLFLKSVTIFIISLISCKDCKWIFLHRISALKKITNSYFGYSYEIAHTKLSKFKRIFHWIYMHLNYDYLILQIVMKLLIQKFKHVFHWIYMMSPRKKSEKYNAHSDFKICYGDIKLIQNCK